MAAEVLRRGVHDDVGAEVERLLEEGGRERVVHDDDRADVVRRCRRGLDVDDVQHRVRRRLDPHDARVVVEMVAQVRELLRRHVVEEIALRLVHLRRHAIDAAVDVGDEDDALAGVDEVHQRRRGSEAGREGDAVIRALDARADLARDFAAAGEPGRRDIDVDRFGEDAPGELALRQHVHGDRGDRGS